MDLLDSLNDIQKTIVTDTEGPILVSAGAGSGKTRVLTNRICYLIRVKNVDPHNILAITFTNKATKEMSERVIKMAPQSNGVTIKTFHALCASILRENINKLDEFDRYFSIYDEKQQKNLIKEVISNLKLDEEDIIQKSLYHISKAKNAGLLPDEYLKENRFDKDIDDIVKIYRAYQDRLKNNNSLDFDDLLLKTLELFYTCPDVLEYYQNKYKYIHVDEFQDTNLVQYKLLKCFAKNTKNIFVVGDEDQCIYCWRGANIENITNFIKDFSPKIYKLEQNYRSTKNIIKVANKLIKNNYTRIDKTLYTDNIDGEEVKFKECIDENEEAEYVAREIYMLKSKGVELNEIGVLMRISSLSRLIEEKLLNYNIPYKVSGIFKFFERLEIKNILAYLTMIVNPKDNSNVARIINYPKRGIGQATIDKLLELSINEHKSLVDLIEDFRNLDVSSAIKSKLAGFSDLIGELKAKYKNSNLYDFVEFVIDKTEIKSLYNTNSEEDIDRKLNIDQLLQSVKSYENLNEDATLIDYLESVTLQNTLEEEDNNELSVAISTIHASKGLEFEYVFLIGLEDGIFPLSRSKDNLDEMEEERRLMYVAITRAKNKLYVTRAKSRFLYGNRKNTLISGFISEMGIENKSFDNKHFSSNSYNSIVNNYRYNESYFNEKTSNTYSNYGEYKEKLNDFKFQSSNNHDNLEKLQGILNKKVNNQKKKVDEYKVGVQVLHTKFGVGTIIKVDDEGTNNYVSVDFGKLGVKTLSLNFAPLQILKK